MTFEEQAAVIQINWTETGIWTLAIFYWDLIFFVIIIGIIAFIVFINFLKKKLGAKNKKNDHKDN